MIAIKPEKRRGKFLPLLAVIAALACASAHPPRTNDPASALQTLNARIDSLSRHMVRLETLLRTLRPDPLTRTAQADSLNAPPAQTDADSALTALPRPEAAPLVQRRQCQAITKSGKRCTRPAKPGRPYCWQHDH